MTMGHTANNQPTINPKNGKMPSMGFQPKSIINCLPGLTLFTSVATCIAPRLVGILYKFCDFQKGLVESQRLKSITITYQWLPSFFLTNSDLHY